MLADKMTISQTAERLGVTLRTLRFYEQIGLVKPIRRGATRIYSAKDRVRLELIGTGKRLGLSLAAIRALIETRAASCQEQGYVQDDEDPNSVVALLTKDEIKQQLQVLERQLDDVKAAIADLTKVDGADQAG